MSKGDHVMRAKFQIAKIEEYSDTQQRVFFHAVAAKSYGEDGLDEDNTYAKFSPSATCEISITNPALFRKLTAGKKYYVDFIETE